MINNEGAPLFENNTPPMEEVGIYLIFGMKIPIVQNFTGKILYNVIHKRIS